MRRQMSARKKPEKMSGLQIFEVYNFRYDGKNTVTKSKKIL